jgi:hypothetical protein
MTMSELAKVAKLLSDRNVIDAHISQLIQRPATQGHIGEFIAAHVFDIRLMDSACNKTIDGYFVSGPLAGRSVDVKFYGLQDGLLAILEEAQPDYFLVLTGPRSTAMSSKGRARPCVIEHVYVFDGPQIAQRLKERGARFGVAASVPQNEWSQAEIFPTQTCALL